MTTAKTYEEIKAMLKDHDCEFVDLSNPMMETKLLMVNTPSKNYLYICFKADEEVVSASVRNASNARLFSVMLVDHIQLWCSEITFFNANNVELAKVAVESSD